MTTTRDTPAAEPDASDQRPLAEYLAELPMPVLERLTAILRCVGGMSHAEKVAAGTYLGVSSMHVVTRGSADELPIADLLTTTAEFVELTHRLATGQEVD